MSHKDHALTAQGKKNYYEISFLSHLNHLNDGKNHEISQNDPVYFGYITPQ